MHRQVVEEILDRVGALGVLLDAPNLAGEVNIYIDTQLKAFRIGKREHEIMSEVAAHLVVLSWVRACNL
jgi:cytochrome c553